eukprot:TRINITY_DN10366_c0_g1_i3.p1 TRINITY_DN10366_c0_g1~~TRINITY_DN10366_c0_g1_i3.p1  ORF type:complete len:481 (-),score=90.95 TRINITY_DN10366_c0_g1_i3:95-1537(-)
MDTLSSQATVVARPSTSRPASSAQRSGGKAAVNVVNFYGDVLSPIISPKSAFSSSFMSPRDNLFINFQYLRGRCRPSQSSVEKAGRCPTNDSKDVGMAHVDSLFESRKTERSERGAPVALIEYEEGSGSVRGGGQSKDDIGVRSSNHILIQRCYSAGDIEEMEGESDGERPRESEVPVVQANRVGSIDMVMWETLVRENEHLKAALARRTTRQSEPSDDGRQIARLAEELEIENQKLLIRVEALEGELDVCLEERRRLVHENKKLGTMLTMEQTLNKYSVGSARAPEDELKRLRALVADREATIRQLQEQNTSIIGQLRATKTANASFEGQIGVLRDEIESLKTEHLLRSSNLLKTNSRLMEELRQKDNLVQELTRKLEEYREPVSARSRSREQQNGPIVVHDRYQGKEDMHSARSPKLSLGAEKGRSQTPLGPLNHQRISNVSTPLTRKESKATLREDAQGKRPREKSEEPAVVRTLKK